MQLIVDTNIIISALLKAGTTRDILFHPSLSFFLPEYSLDEIRAHWDFIVKKSKLTSVELTGLLRIIMGIVNIIPESVFGERITQAKEIMREIDIKDAPFIALALSFRNEGIWSQDKDLQRQSLVRVWRTQELLELIRKGMIR
jgi:predicted nucleic acid-binding protein